MAPTIPTITALVAALLGLLGALLTANVIINRVRTRINAGDGGDPGLAQAIRAGIGTDALSCATISSSASKGCSNTG